MQRMITLGISVSVMAAIATATAAVVSAEEGFLPRNTNGFTFVTKEAVFETTPGAFNVTCKLAAGTGTLASDKHGTVTVAFEKCKAIGFAINSLGDKKETILVASALVLVCLLAGGGFGLFLELPAVGVHMEVPFSGLLVLMTGSVIGVLLGANVQTYGTDFLVNAMNEQAVKECKEGMNNKVAALLSEPNENKKPEVTTVETEAGALKLEEVMELMDS